MKRTRIATPGEVVSPEVYEKALRDGLKAEFPKTQVVKAKKNFSPSKLGFGAGACPRMWQYLFEGGYEHVDNGDHKSQLKRLTGTLGHEIVQGLMGDGYGWEFEKKLINETPPIFGFVDVYDKANNVPVELKFVDSGKFNTAKSLNKAESSHVVQVLMYMKILGADQSVLFYIDRTTLDTHAFSIIMNDHHKAYIDGLWKWMENVRAAFINGEVVARPEGFTKNSFPCTFCPLSKVCYDDDREPTISIVKARSVGY